MKSFMGRAYAPPSRLCDGVLIQVKPALRLASPSEQSAVFFWRKLPLDAGVSQQGVTVHEKFRLWI
jgi:hypothetical protein